MTQQKRNTVETLLGKGVSQHEIHRKTGIDRKTIRKIGRGMAEVESNSGVRGPYLLHSRCGPQFQYVVGD